MQGRKRSAANMKVRKKWTSTCLLPSTTTNLIDMKLIKRNMTEMIRSIMTMVLVNHTRLRKMEDTGHAPGIDDGNHMKQREAFFWA